MPLVDFNALLQRKYDLMQQNANTAQFNSDTQRMGMLADANLTNVRAGLLPGQARADIGLAQAQALAERARARGLDVESSLAPSIARANIGESLARARGFRADASLAEQRLGLGINLGRRPVFTDQWLHDNYGL